MNIHNSFHILYQKYIYRRGRVKAFYVLQHGTEIIEVEVWPHIVACYRKDSFKVTDILWQVDTNVQYTSRTLIW